MGGSASKVASGRLLKARRSFLDVQEKIEEAQSARRNADYRLASIRYEEAALASIHNQEPPGLAGSHYLEAANCAQTDYEEMKAADEDMGNLVLTDASAKEKPNHSLVPRVLLKPRSTSRASISSNASIGGTKELRRTHASAVTVTSGGSPATNATTPREPRETPQQKMARVLRLLENSATHFTKGKRMSSAAGVRKRLAQLHEEELNDSKTAMRYYEMASRDYESEDMTNNAVDCDLLRANIAFKENPLQSLDIFKLAAKKLIKKQQFTSARPVVHKIVLITGSLYDISVAKTTCDSYISGNRALSSCVELRRLNLFFDALNDEDGAMVTNIIEETRDPWAKELMIKMKHDYIQSDADDMK